MAKRVRFKLSDLTDEQLLKIFDSCAWHNAQCHSAQCHSARGHCVSFESVISPAGLISFFLWALWNYEKCINART